MLVALFTWWYGPGWSRFAHGILNLVDTTLDSFSVQILLRTLFQPWKRIVTYPGSGLDTKVRSLIDNLVSRAVGFSVRALVLMTAGIVSVAIVVIGGLLALLWPLVPLLIIALPIVGAFL